MLVTKLKNSRNFAVILILMILLGSACGMVAAYPVFRDVIQPELEDNVSSETLDDIVLCLQQGNYFLYNEAVGGVDRGFIVQNYDTEQFFLLLKYMDYEMFDFEGNALLEEKSEDTLKKLVQKDTEYVFRISFTYDEYSGLRVTVDGTKPDEQRCYELENLVYRGEVRSSYLPEAPDSVKVIYAFTNQNLERYAKEHDSNIGIHAVDLSNNKVYLTFEWAFCLFVIAAALLIPCNKNWKIGEQAIFRVPLECVWLVWGTVASLDIYWSSIVYRTLNHTLANVAQQMGIPGTLEHEMEEVINVCMWFGLFAVVYWGATCMRAIFTMKKEYWKERTLCGKMMRWAMHRRETLGEQVKQGAGEATGFLRKLLRSIRFIVKQVYDWMIHLDFRDRTNHTILRIVAINFLVLFVITFFWYHRFTVLMIYSVILFLFLRKYMRDVQKKYKLLLASMNLLAMGNLDAPIEGDMGIFNPMKTEIQKIQRGFKKAVEEEVKSERMKTELITNVSHDLKTPLTAIITYIDLLKLEKDPQRQKEYLDVLERKSLRLKVLIEDLFEISKATSRNVTMNFIKADIVQLLKQVSFENEGKIREANLDFRWSLPEERVVMLLDVQKTYRIFENLIVNITKYAMPHTRVYVELTDEGNQVWISMKNVSASELNFNTEEITDRFVRGDTSRNTEGSGLGLAIAKSFTELQYGTLIVSTEADLFKVNICLPRREEENPQQDRAGYKLVETGRYD